MLASVGRLLLVFSLAFTLVFVSGIEAANARFGFRLPGVRGLSLPLPGRRGLRLPGIYGRHGLGRTLGIVGAATVGAVILHRLGARDRGEVARRARGVVTRDPNDRVVDTYRSPDGGHQVTMTADPVRKAAEFKDDPALQKITDTDDQISSAGNTQGMPTTDPKVTAKGKEKAPPEKELVKLSELPEDTSCRRVTTEYEAKAQANRKAKTTAEAKESNTAIMCQTSGGEWKPAGA